MACKFFEMLEKRWAAGARVCIGLDSDAEKVANIDGRDWAGDAEDVLAFNKEIIDATHDIALAYKPNAAFYTSYFWCAVLTETLYYLKKVAPEVPVILDAKRADIGNTNRGYVDEAFHSGCGGIFDAVTVNPYFGMEAMKPFLEQKDKGIIVLCRTSNKGAGEFQDLEVSLNPEPPGGFLTTKLYKLVAENVATKWNYNGNCALVVGATYPEELAQVRGIVGDMWLLVPGVGTQGGDAKKVVKNGLNKRGSGIIVNSSSGIIFASSGPDFAQAARMQALWLTEAINAALPKPGSLVDKIV